MFDLMDTNSLQAEIKVFGVGGGGGNAVDHMLRAKMEGVTFINANTDAQVLEKSGADTILQLGEMLTKGLGAGADPNIGREAAMEDRDRISESIEGADMLFITAGMGGGTGTGAAPVVAELAKEKGILTVAVVTRPFIFEGGKRLRLAEQGLADLEKHVDSLIIIPNDKVLEHLGGDAPMEEALAEANQVLHNAVQGIAELITRPGVINVDFADVRTVMSEMGMAMMGSATSSGDNRAEKAAHNAISSPLLEDVDLHGARGLLVNVTAGRDLTIGEYSKVGTIMHQLAGEDANVVMGSAVDMDMDGDLRVTVVATGLGGDASGFEKPMLVESSPPAIERTPLRKPLPTRRHESTVASPVTHDPAPTRNPAGLAGTATDYRPPARNNYDRRFRSGHESGSSDQNYLEIPTYLRKQQAD